MCVRPVQNPKDLPSCFTAHVYIVIIFLLQQELSFLEELVFVGNPLVDLLDQDPSIGPFKPYAEKTLPKLKKLDGRFSFTPSGVTNEYQVNDKAVG